VTHRSTVSQHGLSCRVGAALAHLAGGRHRAHAPGPIGHPASLRSHTCRCRALQIPPIATTRPHRRRRVTRTGTQGRRTRARRPRYLSPFTFLVESRRSRSPARQVRANTYVLLRPPVRASAVPLANTDCTSSNSPSRGLPRLMMAFWCVVQLGHAATPGVGQRKQGWTTAASDPAGPQRSDLKVSTATKDTTHLSRNLQSVSFYDKVASGPGIRAFVWTLCTPVLNAG
jgi:hypothetical protein